MATDPTVIEVGPDPKEQEQEPRLLHMWKWHVRKGNIFSPLKSENYFFQYCVHRFPNFLFQLLKEWKNKILFYLVMSVIEPFVLQQPK